MRNIFRSAARRLRRHLVRRKLSRMAGPAVLDALATAHPQARFVQVGANDGEMMDPVRSTIVRSQWTGLVIEPVPRLFAQLRANYASASDRVTPVNVAVAQSAEPAQFFHLSDVPGKPLLPDWAQGLGTFRKEVIEKHADRIPDFDSYLQSITVPCMTLQAICDEHSVEQLDLLAIDTEGYDFEIIRQIDFARMAPLVIIYEHHHFDTHTHRACIQLLQTNGYLMFEEGLDTWCLRAEDPRAARLVKHWHGWVARSSFAKAVGQEQSA